MTSASATGHRVDRPSLGAAPAPPPGAENLFPAGRWTLAQAYAAHLAGAGVERGLIGPREVERLWERHVLNSLCLSSEVPGGVRVCDIGSGAGLPGVPLAIARPDLMVTLVEPLLRRATFLQEVVDELGLSNVEVRRDRADALHGRCRFEVVTSRAVAPLERLLPWSVPLVEPGGLLLAMKGSSASEEVQRSTAVWRSLGCVEPEVMQVSLPGGLSTATLVRVALADPAQVDSRLVDAQRPRAKRSSRRPSRARPPHGRT